MAEKPRKSLRSIRPHRHMALGALAAAVAGTAAAGTAAAHQVVPGQVGAVKPGQALLVAAEVDIGGEGEGGATVLAPAVALARDLSFTLGHLRAGLALYEAGDLAGAKAHMGRPLVDRQAAAPSLAEHGPEGLAQALATLAEAVENEVPLAEVQAHVDRVTALIAQAEAGISPKDRIKALITVTRTAGGEYAAATEGGKVTDLEEYQSSWGFVQAVREELTSLAQSDDPALAKVAQKMLDALAATDKVFGDLHGQGDFEVDASNIYGAAARMELAAARLR